MSAMAPICADVMDSSADHTADKADSDMDKAHNNAAQAGRRERIRIRRRGRRQVVAETYRDRMNQLYGLDQQSGLAAEIADGQQSVKKKSNENFVEYLRLKNCPKSILDQLTQQDKKTKEQSEVKEEPMEEDDEVFQRTAKDIVETEKQQSVPNLDSPKRSQSPETSNISVRISKAQAELKRRYPTLDDPLNGPRYPSKGDTGYQAAKSAMSEVTRNILAERLKQDSYVVRRVRELGKDGLWTAKRIPKVCEKPRPKTHWDFLLQEMQWLSVDFYQERTWKKSVARMLAYSAKDFVERWQEKKEKERLEKEKRMKKIAAFMANQVKNEFWGNLPILEETITSESHSDINKKKPVQEKKESCDTMPLASVENGILDDNEVENDGSDSSCIGSDDSTISEQERFELENKEWDCETRAINEIKGLNQDSAQPLHMLVPEDYYTNHADNEAIDSIDEAESESVDSSSSSIDWDNMSNEVYEEDSDDGDYCEISELPLEDIEDLLPVKNSPVREEIVCVQMNSRQRQLYDDYLVTPKNASAVEKGDISDLADIISHLRRICNHPRLTGNDSTSSSSSLSIPRISDPNYHRLFRTLLDYDPFENIDIASHNLVFLTHESTLTAITSNRISKFCASKAQIEALPNKENASPAPKVPSERIALETHWTNSQRGITVVGKVLPYKIPESKTLTTGSGSATSKSNSTDKKSDTSTTSTNSDSNSKNSSDSSLSSSSKAFHSESLKIIASCNERRCKGLPLYGEDLISALTVVNSAKPTKAKFRGMSYVNCLNAFINSPRHKSHCFNRGSDYMHKTNALSNLVSCVKDHHDMSVPVSVDSRVTLEPGWSQTIEKLERKTMPALESLSHLYSKPILDSKQETTNNFPTLQKKPWDSSASKVNELISLLEDVRTERKKVIVFCQMDELLQELKRIFFQMKLPFVYLDSKGSKKKRIEQFSRFTKISDNFCLLTSTSSSPLYLEILPNPNLTRVILFDCPSWSVSSRQVVRWCQWLSKTTPGIHIQGLVSADSVEENLAVKSIRDRLLTNLKTVHPENGVKVRVGKQTAEALLGIGVQESGLLKTTSASAKEKLFNSEQLVQLSEINDEIHSEAMRDPFPLIHRLWTNGIDKDKLMSENENVKNDLSENHNANEILNNADDLLDKMTPLQRYGQKMFHGLSVDLPNLTDDILFDTETEKSMWEIAYQTSISDLEAELDLLDLLPCLTYSYEDATRSWHGMDGQPMPLWTAPSAVSEEDLVEQYLTFLYKNELMEDSELPPVHIKKEALSTPALANSSLSHQQAGQQQAGIVYHSPGYSGMKRTASEAGLNQIDPSRLVVQQQSPSGLGLSQSGYETKPKIKKDDSSVIAPRSLFDRPTQAQLKMRKEKMTQRMRNLYPSIGGLNTPATVAGLRHPLPRPQVDSENAPEWLIQEDWALLHAVRELLELPLNLTVMSPAHTPNWDLVSEMVNGVSRVYRGARQCRSRYETIIIPREEGRVMTYDVTAAVAAAGTSGDNGITTTPSKNKKKNQKLKQLAPTSTKVNKAVKTSQLFTQDNNNAWSKLYVNRFEQIKAVANKQTPTTKPLLVNTMTKNSKHAAVLAESGIAYETPLNPIKVAANRAERIQKEKQRSAQDQHQLAQQQRVQAAQNAANVAKHTAAAQSRVAALANSIPQQQQIIQGSQIVATSVANIANSAPTVVVGLSQPSSTTNQQVIVQGSSQSIGRLTAVQQSPQQQHQTVQDLGNRVAAGASASPSSVASTPQQACIAVSTTGSATGTVVSVANITPGQLQARLAAGAIPRALIPSQTKTMTQAQLQLFKQQQLIRKAQEQAALIKAKGGVATVVGATTSTGQKVSVAVTPGTIAAGSQQNVSGSTVAGLNAVTVVTQSGQPRAQLIRQLNAGSGKGQTSIRAMTESDMRILLKQQALSGQGGKATQVTSLPGNFTAQLLSQGIQLQGSGASGSGTSVATLVKTVTAGSGTGSPVTTSVGGSSVAIPVANVASIPAVKASIRAPVNANQQQMIIQRQFLQQRAGKGGVSAAASGTVTGAAGQQQKVAFSQVGGKGVPAQLIVSSGAGQKQLPQSVTVQQLQQLVKGANLQSNLVHGSVLAKQQQHPVSVASSSQHQTVQARVIPVSGTVAGLGRTGQQIQVVAATSNPTVVAGLTTGRQGTARQGITTTVSSSSGSSGVAPNVTIDASGMPSSAASNSPQLASALVSGIKVSSSSPQLFNQVNFGQQVSVAVRSPQIQQQQPKLQVVQQSQQQQAHQQGQSSTSATPNKDK